mgnify:CR=1 FL=1
MVVTAFNCSSRSLLQRSKIDSVNSERRVSEDSSGVALIRIVYPRESAMIENLNEVSRSIARKSVSKIIPKIQANIYFLFSRNVIGKLFSCKTNVNLQYFFFLKYSYFLKPHSASSTLALIGPKR